MVNPWCIPQDTEEIVQSVLWGILVTFRTNYYFVLDIWKTKTSMKVCGGRGNTFRSFLYQWSSLIPGTLSHESLCMRVIDAEGCVGPLQVSIKEQWPQVQGSQKWYQTTLGLFGPPRLSGQGLSTVFFNVTHAIVLIEQLKGHEKPGMMEDLCGMKWQEGLVQTSLNLLPLLTIFLG